MSGVVVWTATVDDGAYKATVTRVGEDLYHGELVVKHVASGEELLRESVGLSYGAPLGPDVDDVATWQERALPVIDADIEKRK